MRTLLVRPGVRAVALRCCLAAGWLSVAIGCAGSRTPPPATRAAAPTQSPGAPPPLPVRFTDLTAQVGLHFQHHSGATGERHFLETTGSGACWFDFDDDGWVDLFLVDSGATPGGAPRRNDSRLFRNRDGVRFEEVTERAGIRSVGYGQGCCVGDYDNDGDLDLYLTHYGPNQLYRNNGDGTFSDVTPKAGAGDSRWSTSAAFADMEGDGDLDLYVTDYVRYRPGQEPPCYLPGKVPAYCPPSQFDGVPDTLYRNNGDGTFTDVTREAGVWDEAGKGLGCVWSDVDDDGDPDLYVANDGSVNRLYRNDGKGRFEDITWTAGVGLGENGEAQAGMGTDAGDVDNDGRFDLVVANFSEEMNSLYRNEGKGLFSDRSVDSGIGTPSLLRLGFGADLFDYDLDGWKDLVVANGHVFDTIGRVRSDIGAAQPPLLYRNLGGRFEDVSDQVGAPFQRPAVARGLATADFDNDGDPDLLMMRLNGPPILLRNDGGNERQWLGLRLRGRSGNRSAIGARVTVRGAGGDQVEEVRSGSGYCSQNDLRLLFGLGSTPVAARVVIRWPGGTEQVVEGLAAGRYHEIAGP